MMPSVVFYIRPSIRPKPGNVYLNFLSVWMCIKEGSPLADPLFIVITMHAKGKSHQRHALNVLMTFSEESSSPAYELN